MTFPQGQPLPSGSVVYSYTQPISSWVQWQLLEYQYSVSQSELSIRTYGLPVSIVPDKGSPSAEDGESRQNGTGSTSI